MLELAASLTATLTGMRCDYAALVNAPVSAVRLTGGVQLNENSSQAVLVDAIAAANAASSCTSARALQRGDGQPPTAALRRELQSLASAPWATIYINLGAGSTAAGATVIAYKVLTAPATAFPLTLAAWAPLWGFPSATAWVSTVGSPLDVVASSVEFFNAASYSPVPAPPSVLSGQQQLGLGVGIGVALAAIIVVFAIAACTMNSRFSSRATIQLRVVKAGALAGETTIA